MADFGLLGGLGEGLQKGLLMYQQTKQRNRENQIQNLVAGVQQDENGNLNFTPEMMKQRQLAAKKTDFDLQNYDPNSDLSVHQYQGMKGFLNAVKPGTGEMIPEGMSGAELDKLKDYTKSYETGELGLLGKGAMAGLMGGRVENMKDRLAFDKHKTAVTTLGNDKDVASYISRYNAINNAIKNFEVSGGMPQEFKQLQQALRINGGGGAGRSGVAERAEGYANTLGLSKDETMQLITGNIQNVDISSPKIVNAFREIAKNELGQIQQQGAKQIEKKEGMFKGIYKRPEMAEYAPEFQETVANQYGQLGINQPGMNQPSPSPQGSGQQPPAPQGHYPAGTIVNVKGKRYQVGSDGDSLTEVK